MSPERVSMAALEASIEVFADEIRSGFRRQAPGGQLGFSFSRRVTSSGRSTKAALSPASVARGPCHPSGGWFGTGAEAAAFSDDARARVTDGALLPFPLSKLADGRRGVPGHAL